MSAAPLRRIVATDESGFHVRFTLECGHMSLMYPYKFKDHKPYPNRRRCDMCLRAPAGDTTPRQPQG